MVASFTRLTITPTAKMPVETAMSGFCARVASSAQRLGLVTADPSAEALCEELDARPCRAVAEEYARAGLPWFEYYGERPAVGGAETLKGLKTVRGMGSLGAMQDWPLRVTQLVDHAEREHGDGEGQGNDHGDRGMEARG